ncbi:ribosome biogenesis GTPase YlqF [Paenibacillus sp. IB182496]|uniref:Ribosome biogenesis GTPase A n=1 Tax=Paenibacillus sabuli TaxID=2772509 RepID=A0A927GSB3_9BACL|nr:ribosome biogenesis GTPase YlqF [Paenibacillus sabuli]MBD2846106.1 ribosome biogenesis GTPase YlqF [Paenibacillus sabuli]
MTIQWFPGHMTKARRQIQDKLKLIDVAIELLDARVPLSSRNPMIDDILQAKPRLIVLNKADLADPRATDRWISFFSARGHACMAVDSSSGTGVSGILSRVQDLLRDQLARRAAKGVKPRAVRGLIVGIPNVGKSTLINRLAGRSIAATGDRPGITKGQQWIKAGPGLELLDTPGILWPKFEDQEVGYRLATVGTIREEILNVEDIAFFALRILSDRYWEALAARFGLEEAPDDPDDTGEIVSLMEEIGRTRGALRSGGLVDLEKVSGIVLRELRAGKLGRLTLEEPPAQ